MGKKKRRDKKINKLQSKRGDIISPINTFQCSVCRRVLYENGKPMELPIICECGKSRMELKPDGKDLRYINVMTEIDGEIFEIV